jgi:hypothetical protein
MTYVDYGKGKSADASHTKLLLKFADFVILQRNSPFPRHKSETILFARGTSRITIRHRAPRKSVFVSGRSFSCEIC